MKSWMVRTLVPALLCFAFWCLLSLDFHPFSLAAAAGFSLLAAAAGAGASAGRPPLFVSPRVARADRLLAFFASVLLQSYRASFDLVGRILTRRYSPGFVRVRTRLRSRVGRVVLANTVSLVPGTLSLWMEEDRVVVHWFDRKTTHSLRAGRLIKESIERRLAGIFG